MSHIKNKIENAAKNAGAETKADVGVFLAGAAAGGLVDATLNFFGFAEPMVVAPLTGAAALALKRLMIDPFYAEDIEKKEVTYEDIMLSVFALEAEGKNKEAQSIIEFVSKCKARDIPASKFKDLYLEANSDYSVN